MTNKRNSANIIDLVQGLDYTIIDSSRSQCSSRSQYQSHHKPPATATASKPLLPDSHPIYGIVNLALLAIAFYLLWANF